ncbi:MAG: site-specific integrase [Actinomycetota bacterium]|nr:site-specific integrase [Actinomycetota bacterium]
MAKKRGNNEGSIYRRKNGTWAAQYTVWTSEGRKRRSVSGKTRAEVSRKLTEAMADRDGGLVYDAGKLTVGEYLGRWLADSVKGTVKETTYANYSYITRVHISPALGRVKLKSLTPAHVRGFYGDKSRSEAKLAAATIRKMHVVLRKALSQAVSDGLIPRNAADGAKPPRVSAPGEEIKPLASEECGAFLEAARGERFEALFVLAVHCGLREGELLALRWEDADLEAAKPAVLVRRTITRGEDGRGYVVGASTKSGRGRRVRLTRRAVAALKDHRKRQLEERMKLAGLWKDQGLIFPNETGSLLNPSNLRTRSFKRIKAASGVREDLRFHDLRHTCATLLLGEGVNAKVVSEMLGHASITITLNTYSHVLPDMQDSAADAMEAALS